MIAKPYQSPEEYEGWPEFPNDAKYPQNFNDVNKPYCWTKTRRFAYLMAIQDYREAVREGMFIDYDGSGRLLVYWGGDYYPLDATWPSIMDEISPEATHIDWYNR